MIGPGDVNLTSAATTTITGLAAIRAVDAINTFIIRSARSERGRSAISAEWLTSRKSAFLTTGTARSLSAELRRSALTGMIGSRSSAGVEAAAASDTIRLGFVGIV